MAGLLLTAVPAGAQEYHQSIEPIEAPPTRAAKPPVKKAAKKPTAARTAPTSAAATRLPLSRPSNGDANGGSDQKDNFTTASLPKAETVKADTRPTPVSKTFADIPFDERIRIQAALFWSGDYAGASGSDDPMLAAVKNYQKRIKAKVTGVLTPAERANLVASARTQEAEFGWSVVVDPATGIRIGLPTKMVPHTREAPRGTRWSSMQGQVQVETFRIKEPGLRLAALFEQQKKEPATRRIEHSVLNDDNFIVSGMQGLKRFSVRAKIRDGEVRGFTILYDQMMETIVAPVMVAMASAFSPFPERIAPFAVLTKSVEYGNGLVVSAHGHIVTDRKLVSGCQVIIAAGLGDAERVAEDKANELVLLRVYSPHKLSPITVARDLPKTTDITLVGIPHPKEENGTKKLTEIKARLVEGAAIELRQPMPMAGLSGAPAIDAMGRFVGMTEMRNAVFASTEPAAPPVRLVSADAIRTFLSAHNVDVAATGGDTKASVVRIICVRK